MRKFAAVVAVVFGLMVVPHVAGADPIGTNACLPGDPFFVCDIYADYDSGLSILGELDGAAPNYLTGYTLFLKSAADVSSLDVSDVEHILVVHQNFFELYSSGALNPTFVFANIFAAATASTPQVDKADVGQILGCPDNPNGVKKIGNVGYCQDEFTLFPNTAAGIPDQLTVHGTLPTDGTPTPVPEPGTLTLLTFGGSAAAAAIRRRRAAKAS